MIGDYFLILLILFACLIAFVFIKRTSIDIPITYEHGLIFDGESSPGEVIVIFYFPGDDSLD